ncbi:sugar transporter, putative, partial [Ixodes scapularis]
MPEVAESPRWLFQSGRSEEAMRSLQFYEGDGAKESFEMLQSHSSVPEAFSLAAFKLPYVYKPFLCVLLGMFLQQFSGISIVLFYTQDIFETAGSTIASADSAIIVGMVQVACGVLATLLIDRLGRKILLLFSCSVSCLSLVTLGAFYHLKDSGFATGISTAFNFGCGALILREYHSTMYLLGNDGLYWFYGANMALGFLLVLLFIPETKGKTLEEIEVSFGKTRQP